MVVTALFDDGPSRDAIPASTGRRVLRPRLVSRIEQSDNPLLLMVAPSGFGKTHLLGQWAASTAADVVWVTCRESDRDPAHFWPHLVAACADRWPAMGTDSSLLLRRPSWAEDDLDVALARDLAEVHGTAVIVLDDSQLVEPLHRSLASLARLLPGAVRVVMASQHNPVLSTSRLRLDGIVDELRTDELAFSEAEVAELLRMAEIELAPEDRQRLHRLTEGWPAGIQMAILAMRRSHDPKGVVDAFATTTAETSDYLANEVISRLSPDLTDFLAKISILDEFDAELCEAVTGEGRARQLLDRVVANDLFVYRVDLTGVRFRFHQMFAAYLRNLLKSRGNTAYRNAHQRAGEALSVRGDRVGALRHAMAVGDLQRAADIVTDSIATVLEVDDARQALEVARAWLARFGAEELAEHPEQYLQCVFLLATRGQREAERWLVAFDQAHPSPPPTISAFAHATWGGLHLNRGDTDAALAQNALAAKAADQAAVDGTWLPKLAELPLQEAGAHILTGDLAAADGALSRRTPLLSSPIVDEVRSPAVHQWILFLQGDLMAAERLTRRLRRAGAEHHAVSHGVGLILADLVEAGLHLERNELPQAAVRLASARTSAEINGRPLVQTVVERWVARLATARRDRAGALAAIAQARIVLGGPSRRVQAQLAVDELRIFVELDPDHADALIPQLPDEPTSRLLLARLAVVRREWATATQILEGVEPMTVRDQVEWGTLCSLVHRERDLRRAHRHLADVVTLAMPHRYLTTITGGGSRMIELLRSMPADVPIKDYVDTLVRAADTTAPTPAGPEVTAAGGGLLTSREIDVLRLLSSRLTSHEIAQTLFISMNTLKSHLKSIYLKLGVNSRAQAVRVAGARGLLHAGAS